VLFCRVLNRKYGHLSAELRKTTIETVSLSKGLSSHAIRHCVPSTREGDTLQPQACRIHRGEGLTA
jgi:hypothetical protein